MHRVFEWCRRRWPPAAPSPAEVAALLAAPSPGWSRLADAGTALISAERFAEADAVYAAGLARFGDDPTLLVGYALVAHCQGLYREAIARWCKVLSVSPTRPMAHFCLAANHREIGEIERATEIVATGLARFPDDHGMIAEAARVAEARGDFEGGLDLWRRVGATTSDLDATRGAAHAAMVLGRFDEAETMLAAGLRRAPDARSLLAVRAMVASAREDWPRAIPLWADYRSRFPDDKAGWEHHGRAVQASLLSQASLWRDAAMPSGPGLRAPLDVGRVEDDDLRRLMLGFESIGDNCEFGSVQRRYGAEPLGLLRWNDVGFDNLLAALAEGFADMGEAEHTDMPALANGEFVVRDRRWGLWMHTFLFEGQVERDALFDRMCRRIVFLRDMFLADLAAGEKVFLHRSAGLPDDQLERLHRALAAYGPVRLLAVQPVGATNGFDGAPGEVRDVAPGRKVGFLRRLGVAEGNYWDIAFDDWVAVCRRAIG